MPILRRLTLEALALAAASALGAAELHASEPVRVAQAAAQAEEKAPAASEPEAGAKPAPEKAPKRPDIEEIVIRAGESQSAEDYQAGDSVTGFDATDLEALGAQTIEGLSKFTPNLEIVTSGATTPTFFIRGVGLNDFNANSTGAVSIYQDDVPINSPALQLGTLFDMEAVNVLRGPQGTGPARNASAGAIKLYTRKPSGEYGSYLRSDFGSYSYMDFEGALEAPIYEDMLSGRLAFRWTQRDGYAKNGCGDAPPLEERNVRPNTGPNSSKETFPEWSLCGESVPKNNVSPIAEGLPTDVNDLGNWAARGTLRFQPTLDQDWLLSFHGGMRDEQSRLGLAYGTRGDIDNAPFGGGFGPEDQNGILGGEDVQKYQKQEVQDMFIAAFPCARDPITRRFVHPEACNALSPNERKQALADAQYQVGEDLANDLDTDPHRGDYDKVGPTQNNVWGTYLKGEIALPYGLLLTTVTGYDTYDRLIDVDLDFSPNPLFEIRTDDDGWQFTEDLRLSGQLAEGIPVRWEIGGYYLMETLNVKINNDFGRFGNFGVAEREYTQKLWSAAGYFTAAWDFWKDFTLDGGFRWNWDQKSIDYFLKRTKSESESEFLENTDFQEMPWSAPTGTVRLTYRFREDTHAYWKYTRGWKGGHYNATSSLTKGVTSADPETIDAFETGLRGSWLEGRLGLDLAFFYYNYDNYQLFTIANTFGQLPEFVILNAKSAEVYGAELDLQARPFAGSFVNVRFSWLESQFLDFVQIQEIPDTDNKTGQFIGIIPIELQFTGNRLLNSPRFKVSLTAEQTVPLGRYGSVTARYDGAWTDTTFFDATEGRGIPNQAGQQFLPDNTIGQKPFWIHNVRVGYRPPIGNVEIAGWVRNLTDEVYKTFAFDASTFRGTSIYFVGEPRTYGLSFTVGF
jgi:iron complex outermembrane receptor protein